MALSNVASIDFSHEDESVKAVNMLRAGLILGLVSTALLL